LAPQANRRHLEVTIAVTGNQPLPTQPLTIDDLVPRARSLA
jgi:hypothetical protein